MSETTPDPADVHTGTDRVELTKDEKRALNIPLFDTHSTNLYAAVESIVPAHGQALTAELDTLRLDVADRTRERDRAQKLLLTTQRGVACDTEVMDLRAALTPEGKP